MIRQIESVRQTMRQWIILAARLATSGEFLFDQLLPFETPLTPITTVTPTTLAKQ